MEKQIEQLRAAQYFANFVMVGTGSSIVEYHHQGKQQLDFLSTLYSFHGDIAKKALQGFSLTDKQKWILAFELGKREDEFQGYLADIESTLVKNEAEAIIFEGYKIERLGDAYCIYTTDGYVTDEYELNKFHGSVENAKELITRINADNEW